MATSTTYSPSGVTNAVREDLSDIITNIAPTDTVFMSNIGKTKVKNTYTEWLIDTLNTAANCAVTEGNDAVLTTINAQTRTGNYTQIGAKWFAISDTLEEVDKAGRKSEIAYQTTIFLKTLARDMEYGLINNALRTSVDPRAAMGLKGWLTSCAYNFTTGTASTTLTETRFNDQIAYQWGYGGNPNMVLAQSNQKRTISGFTGNSKITTNMDADNKKIILSVDYYESDFGVVKVYASRFIAEDSQGGSGGNGSLSGAGYYTVYFLEKEKFQMGVLKPLKIEKLAKTGLSQKIQISTEYTLISRQQAASGQIQRCAPVS